MKDKVQTRLVELWSLAQAGDEDGPDYLACAKLLKGVFAICDVKKTPMLIEKLEEMIDFLVRHISLMGIDELVQSVKAIRYAERQIAGIRGIQYGAALSRNISATQAAELRGAGVDSDRSGSEDSFAGDQSDSLTLGDILSDLDDDPES